MKITHASTMRTTASHSTWFRNLIGTIGAITGWTFFMLTMLLTAYETGWTLFTISLFGSATIKEVLPDLPVLCVITTALGWLVARFIASPRAVGVAILITFPAVLIAELIWTQAYPNQSLFWARQLAWSDSTVKDYEKFPVRSISNAAPAFHFGENLSPELFQTIEYRSHGELKQMGFEEFLRSTQTTSFIVIKDDAILYEGYFNGYTRDSLVTSFSMAKSVTSALIGIAIDEGYIGGVNDLMIDYTPELTGKGFDNVTIRDLLLMSSGIRYLTDDEISPLAQITQFTDDGLSYSYPDLRSLALRVKMDEKGPGAEFNYNNYNTILLGLILERSTGRSPSEYLQEKVWEPLGMEYPASWDLDSEKSEFELIASGINGRAIDFAKFGRLFLNYGNWNGTQIISPEWVFESTAPDPDDHRVWHSDASWKEAKGYYKYQWWGKINSDGSYDYLAQGHLGQRIYVSPQAKMIIVRFGTDEGGVDEWTDVFQSIIANVKATTKNDSLTGTWPTSTPEEQGFDSAKLAEGLLAIKKNGTLIHSLMILRNDRVILDAYFYPYDGSTYHDLASVTKSVMTTLIGIAADQNKLNLDDPMLSFFPDREIANRDERKEKITIRHLASMGSGLDCDPMNDEVTMVQMRASKDWIQFALDLPVVKEPGKRFVYCSVNMHLLSAILQKATGMNALEFARKNLFGPLGIQDVYWPADPQGVTHGWGDLCLRPADMAKLGSLFMHEGQWENQKIVSREWVQSALQGYMKGTGRIEDYGYGWWIGQPDNEPEFLAAGNGGQKIKVYPRLKMIMVMTGGGFEYSEIEPYMLAAMSNLEQPLPANPAGVASLNAALVAISPSPQPEPVLPLPEIAKAISGETFVFEPNPLLRSFRLDFDNSAEAIFQFELANEPGQRVLGIGLDGVYRHSYSGRPVIARGFWEDEKTFVMDYDEGPGITFYRFRLHFDGDGVLFEGSGWRVRANKK
ncbi:MAG TPA: serine hydrolase [Anaerolineales bacterium]|nr:serine hydrolase [Anaerolineales bacterium]